jgi:hypothetical protein
MRYESPDAARRAYQPPNVRLLFVGESPPAAGRFFYYGDSGLAVHTRQAFDAASMPTFDMDSFLAFFKARGCYLVDLCRVPVNSLPDAERAEAREAGVAELAETVAQLRPDAVIAVMKDIESLVIRAVAQAGVPATPVHAVPFPSHGHGAKYEREVARLLTGYGINDLVMDWGDFDSILTTLEAMGPRPGWRPERLEKEVAWRLFEIDDPTVEDFMIARALIVRIRALRRLGSDS